MHKTKSGFTIVELLIVIVVIGILASITVVAFNGVRARALESEKISKVSQIQKALESYKVINGTYPGTTQIGGSAGAQLLGMTLQGVSVSTAPTAGIEGGWVDSGSQNIRYMTADNPDGSGFACGVSPCGSYWLGYWDRVKNEAYVVTNPR